MKHKPSTAEMATTQNVLPQFYVFRRPVLNLTDMFHDLLPHNVAPELRVQSMTTRAKRLASIPMVQEALRIASPDLAARLSEEQTLKSDEDSRASLSLVRYLSRMCSRATPFGLFAGTGLQFGKRQHGEVCGIRVNRFVRLDCAVVFAVVDQLVAEPDVRRVLKYSWNDSCIRRNGDIVYVAVKDRSGMRRYELEKVEAFEELLLIADAAAVEPMSYGALSDQLAQTGVDSTEVDEFLNELIDCGLLRSTLEPSPTAGDPLIQLSDSLRNLGTSVVQKWLEKLDMVTAELDGLRASEVGADLEAYEAINRLVASLDIDVPTKFCLQVDTWIEDPRCEVPSDLLALTLEAARVLAFLFGTTDTSSLRAFREAFFERYEQRSVSLVEALDPEIGIGFPPENGQSATTPETSRGSALLMRMFAESVEASYRTIELSKYLDVTTSQLEQVQLPSSFSAQLLCTSWRDNEGRNLEHKFVLRGASGPSAANLLGRFCYLDETLNEQVTSQVEMEEAQLPEAAFAEVLHVPQGRLGNILWRPKLRRRELPYLCRSTSAASEQVAVGSLTIGLEGGRLILRDDTGTEIVPRLSTAHNIFAESNLPLYRFLGELQTQGVVARVAWNWGQLARCRRLPRVEYKGLVLSRASWTLEHAELKKAIVRCGSPQAAIRDLCGAASIPRFVHIAEGDNELLVDLDDPTGQAALRDSLRKHASVLLVEAISASLPSPNATDAIVSWEAIVPFTSLRPSREAVRKNRPTHQATVAPPRRSFALGSEWAYVKLYGGRAYQNALLKDCVLPLIGDIDHEHLADRWHFVRYADPHPHVRLRFHCLDVERMSRLVTRVHERTSRWHSSKLLWRIQYDTYEREVERYGGPLGIELAERIFHADSVFTLASVCGDLSFQGQLRHVNAVRSLLTLCESFVEAGFGSAVTTYLANLSPINKTARQNVAQRFRQSRNLLRSAGRFHTSTSVQDHFQILLEQRRQDMVIPLEHYRLLSEENQLQSSIERIVGSIFHMHINRLLLGCTPNEEREVMDLLVLARRANAYNSSHDEV